MRPLRLAACGPLPLFVLVLAASACGRYAGLPTDPAEAPAPPPLRDAATRTPGDASGVPDDQIVRVTRRELGADPLTARQVLGVDSSRGIVTLTGTVDDVLAERRAVDIAGVVRGVRAIVDRVEVAPQPRPDYELDFTVAGVLSRDPVTAGERIGAQVRQGTVFLSGEADAYATRVAAERDVLAIPGVRDVVDDVAVVPRPRSDRLLAHEAERMIRDDPWIDDTRVHVSATRGTVRLSGWVGSPAQYARAEDDAREASPGAVDTTALRLEPWSDDGTLRDRVMPVYSDGDIGQALLDAIVRDPRVHPFVPTIDVQNGVIVLTGVAPNAFAVRATNDDARNVLGALTVRDDMKIAPAVETASDRTIRNQVLDAIQRDPRLGPQGIRVDVLQGTVVLTGTIGAESDRLRAISIASSAPGTRDVDDGLVVEPAPLGRASMQPR